MKLSAIPAFKTVTWSGPTRFEPEIWNTPDKVREANCYAYALNDPELGWPWLNRRFNFMAKYGLQDEHTPSVIKGTPPEELEAILAFDGFKPICIHDADPTKDQIIAYTRSLGGHFYRMDSDGIWSHKTGSHPATNLDLLCNNPITDISSALLDESFTEKVIKPLNDLRFFKGDKRARIFPICKKFYGPSLKFSNLNLAFNPLG